MLKSVILAYYYLECKDSISVENKIEKSGVTGMKTKGAVWGV